MEADDCLTLAVHRGTPGARSYRDDALGILLSRDEERCRWFVDLELGEMAGDSDEMVENRHTLRVFFAAKMRIAPAAERLFVHRNTLIHRLGRIETILGHPIGERTAEVQAALAVADLFAPMGAPNASRPSNGGA